MHFLTSRNLFFISTLYLSSLFLSITNTYANTLSTPNYTEVKSSYSDWQKLFRKNLLEFRQAYLKNQKIGMKQIEVIFRNTVAPDSNMIKILAYWVSKKHICVRGPTPIGCMASPEIVLGNLIGRSKPVTSGGPHHNLGGLIVYVETGKEASNSYSKKTPPNTLSFVRGYPFFVFQKINGNIVLVSLSKEINILMRIIRRSIFA